MSLLREIVVKKFSAMAEFNAGVSDGSDIDVVDDLEDDLDGANQSIVDPIDRAQGESNHDHVDDSRDADDFVRQDVEQQSDSDDDFVFEGFHGGWIFDNFVSRDVAAFSLDGGATIVHPPEAGPHDYFSLFWTEELWTHIVEETNR